MSLRASLVPLLLLCSYLGSSCVRLQWARHHLQEEIPEEVSIGLTPGVDTLESCLSRLGAPLYVWEASASTFALAYGWNEGHDWGFTVSVPVSDMVAASVDYGDVNLDLHGLVLIFDNENRLVRRERGYLRDLAPELERRRRPAFVEETNGS